MASSTDQEAERTDTHLSKAASTRKTAPALTATVRSTSAETSAPPRRILLARLVIHVDQHGGNVTCTLGLTLPNPENTKVLKYSQKKPFNNAFNFKFQSLMK
jgi:hypothetical protein